MAVDTLITAVGCAIGLMLAGLVGSAPKQVAPGGRWRRLIWVTWQARTICWLAHCYSPTSAA